MSEQNPPADDVREALAEAQRLADLRLERITQLLSRLGEVHYCPEHGDLLTDTRSLRCSEAHSVEQIRAAVRQRYTVIPTPEEWTAQMDAERARQIEHGYDDAHDAEHGISHLLNWSIDYARRGNTIAAATLARCALHLQRGTVGVGDSQLTADEVDWLIRAARMVRHETEHPTAEATLKKLGDALRQEAHGETRP